MSGSVCCVVPSLPLKCLLKGCFSSNSSFISWLQSSCGYGLWKNVEAVSHPLLFSFQLWWVILTVKKVNRNRESVCPAFQQEMDFLGRPVSECLTSTQPREVHGEAKSTAAQGIIMITEPLSMPKWIPNERKNHKVFINLPQQEARTKKKQIVFWL